MSDDLFLEEAPSRYVVGIDLGTTNSAVCWVDTQRENWEVQVLAIPQLVALGQVEARETLPSFHYQPSAGEISPGGLKLPWNKSDPAFAVGFFARDYGGQIPGRLIGSAKSWLCHPGVDRTADLLPWHAAEDVEKLSPVEASSRYLAHLRDAWNQAHPSQPLEKQDIVLTLPASFDEVARELTIAAAAKAGLKRVVLVEEPQAAFYAWIYQHRQGWEQLVSPGQKILVCDVGGGTTDFTLIRVRQGDGGKIQFHRVAVGDHLILGGDNFDLALAQYLEQKITNGGKLSPRQWEVLLRVSRRAKEEMLGENPPQNLTLTLPGSGTKLIGGSVQVALSLAEVQQVLVDGFLPKVELTQRPSTRRSGFQEFGLPYASDPAITKYLAAFLTAHRHVAQDDSSANLASPKPTNPAETKIDPARPDILLFNGGVFCSPVLRQRLIDSLSQWFCSDKVAWQPQVLENDRLDLAVARGAAYYGMVRRGAGVRIAAGLARTYYMGLEADEPTAICLVPGNAEAGQEITLPGQQFDLLVSQPVEFPLFVSSTRLADRPGEIFPIDRERMTPLPPIRTALKTARRSERGSVTVELHAKLTEIGTLDLWLAEAAGERKWRLQFDVRSTTQTDREAYQSADEAQGVIDETSWLSIMTHLSDTFGHTGSENPDFLTKNLVEAVGADRPEWPTSLLRRIWEALIELEAGRRKSPIHEARWLNLLGYALRPGYGLAVDDWRVAETWKTVQGKLAFSAPTSRTESLILWRRIAGGFSAGQQRALAEPLLATVRALHKRYTTGAGKGIDGNLSPHESLEVLRLLGSLELLPGGVKLELGRMLLDLLPKKKLESLRSAIAWAIGRLGTREPVYGPLNTVIAASEIEAWVPRLLEIETPDPALLLALTQLSRRMGDRYRDLSDSTRDRILGWLTRHNASPHALSLVETGGQLNPEEQNRIFGETLPKGLRVK